MVDTALDALPGPLAASINKFQVAYHLPARGRYIARHVRPDGRREELEYDVARGRCLTVDERKAELPPDRRLVLPDEGVTATSTHFIDDETSQLRVRLSAVDDAGRAFLSSVSLAHSPYERNEEDDVRLALRRHRFPAVYATWPKEQKVAHWATVLHRFRRANGESGHDEDEIYTLGLISDMERTDPQVRDLLPEILASVGWLEQTPADEAIAAFSSRTGIPVGPPTRGEDR